jgi:hypothetical protein
MSFFVCLFIKLENRRREQVLLGRLVPVVGEGGEKAWKGE